MNRNLPLLLCLLLFACTEQPEQKTRITEPTSTGIRSANEILLVADTWYPFNGDPASNSPGLIVELAREAFALEGYTVRYERLPWARAIEGVRAGEADGLIGAGRDEVPDFVFPDNPVVMARHGFFTAASSTWKWSGPASLDSVKLGVIQGYSYGDLYTNYIADRLNDGGQIEEVSGDLALMQNMKKLLAGRVDVVVAETSVAQALLRGEGLSAQVKCVGVAALEPIFIAFSPAMERSHHLARALRKGIMQLEQSGRRRQIEEHYQLPVTTAGTR